MKQIAVVFLMLCLIGILSLTSAATLTVEKRTPNGWSSAYWPFAITVSCTDLSVFNFSLEWWQSSTFVFPDATPIDCSISETMTADQTKAFTSTVGDTYGDDDGQISAADAALVDGQTFYVTNTLKWGGKASSIGGASLASSIPEDLTTWSWTWLSWSDNSTKSSPMVSLEVADPYTCGEWFEGKVVSDNIANTQVTIDLQQQGKTIKLFTPVLNAQGEYTQSINYIDVGSLSYVAAGSYDVIVTATYQWAQDSISFKSNITDQCDEPNYLDMLKERNTDIIDAQKENSSTNNNATPAV